MDKKEKIRQLKKNNGSFVKGAFVTKMVCFLGLCFVVANQSALFVLSEGVLEESILHMVIQGIVIVLILTGKAFFPLMFAAAMLTSLIYGGWLYFQSQSIFYLVQCIYFLLNFVLMMVVLLNKNTKCYRNELKNLEKDVPESTEEIETVQEKAEGEQIDFIEEQHEPKSEKRVVEMDCPIHLELSYGSFSRFLMLHYPFVYLHPKFDMNSSVVQMCISAEGFDQQSNEMYSAEFTLIKQETLQKMNLRFEAEDEMGYLCALICADWLVSQKGTLIENGINVSADLMKKLTEAFVLAQDSKKQSFEGFQNY